MTMPEGEPRHLESELADQTVDKLPDGTYSASDLSPASELTTPYQKEIFNKFVHLHGKVIDASLAHEQNLVLLFPSKDDNGEQIIRDDKSEAFPLNVNSGEALTRSLDSMYTNEILPNPALRDAVSKLTAEDPHVDGVTITNDELNKFWGTPVE